MWLNFASNLTKSMMEIEKEVKYLQIIECEKVYIN